MQVTCNNKASWQIEKRNTWREATKMLANGQEPSINARNSKSLADRKIIEQHFF